MKVFQNKNLFKKLIIVFIVITLFSFCIPKQSQAKDGMVATVGGKLLNPVMSLFVGLGDGLMGILQNVVLGVGVNDSLVAVNTESGFWAKLFIVIAAFAVIGTCIVATVLSAGSLSAITIPLLIKFGAATAFVIAGSTVTFGFVNKVNDKNLPDILYLPMYQITPQEIFSNKLPILDVDFFNPSDKTYTFTDKDGNEFTSSSTAKDLRQTVSNWYVILRDISLVALLSVLVYAGIRIIISSTAGDKAKYKQMLVDWLVAICLLFTMQYIMAFSNMLVEKFIEVIDSTRIDNLAKESNTTDPEVYIINDTKTAQNAYKKLVGDQGKNSPYFYYFLDSEGNQLTEEGEENAAQIAWPAENFLQQARLNSQLLSDDEEESWVAIGWKVIYVVLVVYTFIFMFTYLKRLVYMTFLTIIAPLVAMTYPLDKMNDGKAQAFDAWFKEYIFNLLLQPMHLILYTILISSAMQFASKNIIYVVVALGFLTPAEKLFRKFFGFEKAHTPGLLGGPAGAALMMSGMNKLFAKGPKGKKGGAGGKGSDGGNEIGDDDKKPRMKDFDKENAMIGDGIGEEEKTSVEKPLNNNQKHLDDINGAMGIENSKNKFEAPYSNNELDAMKDYYEAGLGRSITQGASTLPTPSGGTPTSMPKGGALKPLPKIKTPPKRSIRRAVGAVGGYYGRKFKRKLKNPQTWKNVGKKAIRGATMASTTGIGMTAGAIAGITSGDPTKFAQYTATGAIGGYTAGKNIPAPQINQEVREEAQRAYYGSDEEYEKAIHERNRKNFQRDESNIRKLEKEYGGKEARKIMDEVAPQYFDRGIDNIDDIMAAYELEKTGVSRDTAAATAKYASRIGSDTTKMKLKDKTDWQNTFAKEFSKNSRVKENNIDPNKSAEEAMKRIDRFNKLKNS